MIIVIIIRATGRQTAKGRHIGTHALYSVRYYSIITVIIIINYDYHDY